MLAHSCVASCQPLLPLTSGTIDIEGDLGLLKSQYLDEAVRQNRCALQP
jgi:hypothetical protein